MIASHCVLQCVAVCSNVAQISISLSTSLLFNKYSNLDNADRHVRMRLVFRREHISFADEQQKEAADPPPAVSSFEAIRVPLYDNSTTIKRIKRPLLPILQHTSTKDARYAQRYRCYAPHEKVGLSLRPRKHYLECTIKFTP